MGTRSKAKKEQDKWKAVAADMKKKGPGAISDFYSGRMPPPPPRRAPKPPPNKRTGPDFLDQERKKKKNK